MNLIAEAVGVGGQLKLYENKVVIERKGFLAFCSHGSTGQKEILLKSISAIQFKKCGFTAGYIQFVFHGSQESKKGYFDASKDENSILFKPDQQKNFENIKNIIESKTSAKDNSKTQSIDGISEIEKLAGLKQKGIITEDEFTARKRKILEI